MIENFWTKKFNQNFEELQHMKNKKKLALTIFSVLYLNVSKCSLKWPLKIRKNQILIPFFLCFDSRGQEQIIQFKFYYHLHDKNHKNQYYLNM